MKHEPIKKHYNHPIQIIIGDFKPHKGKIMCKSCKKFVKWATKEEIDMYNTLEKEKSLGKHKFYHR